MKVWQSLVTTERKRISIDDDILEASERDDQKFKTLEGPGEKR